MLTYVIRKLSLFVLKFDSNGFLCFQGRPLTQCEQQYQASLEQNDVGAFVPHCKPSGQYAPMQCYLGKCFCVDQLGNEVEGTETELPKLPFCREPGLLLIAFLSLLSLYFCHLCFMCLSCSNIVYS